MPIKGVINITKKEYTKIKKLIKNVACKLVINFLI